MKFPQVALGGLLSLALVMPAYSQPPDDVQPDGPDQNMIQPDDQEDAPAESQSSDAQRVIMDVQSKLNDQGYSSDDGAGQWGSSSAAALQQYQEDHGLQPSGDLDPDTAASLGMSLGEFSAFEAAVGQQPSDQGPEPEDPSVPPPAPDQENP